MSAKAIYPCCAVKEIPQLLEKYTPRYLGISLSLFEQASEVNEIMKAIEASRINPAPQVIVGGFAVKKIPAHRIPGTIWVTDYNEFLSQVLASRKRESR